MKKQVIQFIVPRAEADRSLQLFLAVRLGISKRAAKDLLDRRMVWVNRRSVWMAQHTLRAGDTVEVQGADGAGKAARSHLRVLREDQHYLLIDKPAGYLSLGAGGCEELLRASRSEPSLRVVHRLDRDTSGCLLVARSAAAFEAAVELFKTRRVSKTYHAIAYGKFDREATTIKGELDGARAVTHIQREAQTRDAVFLKIRIETGRTHQIRRHLAQMRCPILGDREYGIKNVRDQRLLSVPRQMLHASELELPHPLLEGERLKAHSPLPADFRRCLKLFDMGK